MVETAMGVMLVVTGVALCVGTARHKRWLLFSGCVLATAMAVVRLLLPGYLR